jgi:hypothetical protein
VSAAANSRRSLRRLELRPPGPDPARLASLLVRVWLEVRAGRRPIAQLTPLVAPAARRRLAAQLARSAKDGGAAARVRTVRTFAPGPDACEASVLVDQGGRTTALAVRLERHRGAWRAVELTAPETGLPALPTASLGVDVPVRDAFDEAAEEAGDEVA